MGDRANYVLIEDDSASIRHSQFGALTIAEWMSRGPHAVIEMIKAHPVRVGLLDDIWCQGTIFIDVTKRLVFFSGDEVPADRPSRRRLLAELRRTWKGWHVAHAQDGVIEIAERLHTPIVELVYRDDRKDCPFESNGVPEDQELIRLVQAATGAYSRRQFVRQFASCSWITIEHATGQYSANVSCHPLGLLLCGTPALNYFQNRLRAQNPPSDSTDGGITFYPETREIKYWFDSAHPAGLREVPDKW